RAGAGPGAAADGVRDRLVARVGRGRGAAVVVRRVVPRSLAGSPPYRARRVARHRRRMVELAEGRAARVGATVVTRDGGVSGVARRVLLADGWIRRTGRRHARIAARRVER